MEDDKKKRKLGLGSQPEQDSASAVEEAGRIQFTQQKQVEDFQKKDGLTYLFIAMKKIVFTIIAVVSFVFLFFFWLVVP